MQLTLLDESNIIKNLCERENPFSSDYFAFYSSWFGGISTNPSLMLLPIDDHMVHRGDGVFEAAKSENRSVYQLDQHLDRLFISAERIALQPPFSKQQMKDIILETSRVANQDDNSIRIYVSRGPGNFSVNPYDSVGSQFYVVVTALKAPPEKQYREGVSLGLSNIICKQGWMAQVKSCNYLQNVLMKKEAVDRGFDFMVSTNGNNNIAESFTENVMIVDSQGHLAYPPLDYILKGTTLIRACELAKKQGYTVVERPITVDELLTAKEIMMTGTSLDVLPVSRIENHVLSVGPVARELYQLMRHDIKEKTRGSVF